MNLSEIIRDRRSIRKYQDREVPREVLSEILEDALWAPSGMNRQNWDVYVVRGEHKDKLLGAVARAGELFKPTLEKLFKEKMVNITMKFFQDLGGAPVVLLVYMPKLTYEIRPDMGASERYRIEHNRYTNMLSAAALIQNLLLLAEAKGLGTCWMTAPKNAEELINEAMGITDKEIVSIIPLGYPDQSPPAPPRKADKIHWLGFE
ncbi:nitroreductase family protein [Pelotomaculum propionicicum]|uniref:Nitroreductase NfnB n=1 Tax=Pelotomaculum propionicicum TaxID=258475 RepID=A0A4Y7RJF5_9FIRM|nr:nitroreductase family protein [Pelotomaculum propionicicum]NLI12972.1 nitroreductase family protein [Peptococcaceae bacterium]TEB08946.1 Nitroreductase NfnB [Pelotomaculum propionicicum]